ncbi:MAG TPA: DNA adenine methylase, partial [Chitinophaga sp.]|uniref:DNA adenine methylase n=1 Tax=Chitinophaga sp. TaxID=1869181 RepID=UPI002DBDCE40
KNTFIYLDPPYMLTTGAYNDGKRGFHGWNSETEKRFFDFVDKLNEEGKPFMISYVLEHKGKHNLNLVEWIKKGGYNIIEVDPMLGNNRKEVLITNYSDNASTTLHHKEQIPEEA